MPVSPADSSWCHRQKQRRIEPLMVLDSRDYGSWLNNSSSSASSPSNNNKSPPVFQTEKKRVHWQK